MGRKKRRVNIDMKPFCYYCDREFDDEKVLIQHQKAKHFKCLQCNRKLDIANGLVVHMMQVHKTNLKTVPNSLPKRNDPELIIRGMNGVPTEIIEDNLNKLKQKLGDKNIKRQQRVNWAQVTMAPTMEEFLQQAQVSNFNFPGFNSPLIPTNNTQSSNTTQTNNINLNKINIPPIPMYKSNNSNIGFMQQPTIGPNMYHHMNQLNNINQNNTKIPTVPPIHLPPTNIHVPNIPVPSVGSQNITPPSAPTTKIPPLVQPIVPPSTFPPNINHSNSNLSSNLNNSANKTLSSNTQNDTIETSNTNTKK
uniref:C2H2-type domain-containing protein n=1 Tax=Piliocolobus tephrosceles TaxID=591936 RepID=A0A8C9H9Q6_9PRIM